MKRLLSPHLPTPGKPVELSESEAKHATQVMRLGTGDQVELVDGQGRAIVAELAVRSKSVYVNYVKDLTELAHQATEQVLPLHLELAIIKGEAMEWAIEKAVELGVQTLTPMVTAHTVVQIDRKGPEVFQERWQKIADQALKQCGRLKRMEVLLPEALEMVLARKHASSVRLWCDEASKEKAPFVVQYLSDLQKHNSDPQEIRLLIGPEGGWSVPEQKLLASSAHAISLGPLILRAETAAVFASGVVAAHLRMR